MLTLLSLLACSGGDTADIATPPPPPVVAPPTIVTPPPSSGGAARTIDLDAPGGKGGAPAGAAFIVPSGTQAELTAGPLSDGSTGMKLVASAEGDALMCTESVQLGPQVTFGTRMKVSAITPGTQAWQGLNVELRARDASGGLISPPGSRYVLLRNERAPSEWTEWEAPIVVPEGAVQGEFCYRFVNSTGTLEVDNVVVKGALGGPTDAPAAGGAAAPTGPVTRWELDLPGGGGGAPEGFDFLIPPGTPGTSAVAGPVAGGTGFTFNVSQASNSLACSQLFPVSANNRARARVRLSDIKTDARAWTGFVAEVRTYDGANALVSPSGSQFTTIGTLKTSGDWVELDKGFAAPPGAASGKLCFRFVESTGSVEVDWAEAG
ncbi:MAG: hypothetical protein Q8P18_22530 [Pseudomonadota bacterium]|nr:hypothetical protein [Pseudomonadota bacterium]